MPDQPIVDNIQERSKQALNWAMQDKHKSRAKKLREELEKAFTEHPEATGETYGEHLRFTVGMSSRFAYAGAAIILHGIFPFLCMKTASNQIESMYRIMKSRIPQKRREEIDKELSFPQKNYTAFHGEARVAIIGGGFSGAMVLANLVEKAQGNITVEWFSDDESLGLGVAYGTKDNCHLLNVRAERMGAFAERVDDFFRWLQTEEGKAQLEALWPGHEITADTYVPRVVYGAYMHHIVQQSLTLAKSKNIDVHITNATIVDASLQDASSQQILLIIERGVMQQEILVDAVVLATGNLPPKNLSFQAGLIDRKDHYVADVWNTAADHLFPARVNELPADAEVVIIGTGLTMADTVLTLRARGYKGTITAISRHGWLPVSHAHGKPYPAWEWVYAPQFAPRTAFGLLKRIREEVARAEAQGYDWRAVIDSLRPVTQQIWKQLSVKEKRRFLNRLSTLWSVHRHRMAHEIHCELKSMQQSGSLKIAAGKIYYVGSDKDGLTVVYRKRGTNRVETLRPTLVLNCTGPEYDIAASDHALLKNLRDRGMVTVGPLRIGIEATESGSARGKAQDALFPLGTLLVGELLECTAVPELREQADQTATNVINRIKTLYEPDYKARLIMGAAI